MNGVDGSSLMTIHVTPEAGFSYASCELHSFAPAAHLSPPTTVGAIVSIFDPKRFVAACTYAPGALAGECVDSAPELPVVGYRCTGASTAALAAGAHVVFYSFERESSSGCALAGCEGGCVPVRPCSSCASFSEGAQYQ
jgi:S-adenosylmethionine decarboxylase